MDQCREILPNVFASVVSFWGVLVRAEFELNLELPPKVVWWKWVGFISSRYGDMRVHVCGTSYLLLTSLCCPQW